MERERQRDKWSREREGKRAIERMIVMTSTHLSPKYITTVMWQGW